MSGQVDVAIAKTNSRRDPPGLDIFYNVTNSGPDPIWLVNDGWIIWSQSGGRIEISLARGKMSPGSAVFGYFVPATVEIPSGSNLARSLALGWPLKLDRLWNREESVRPAPGQYDLVLRIGYGVRPFPDDPILGESEESPVLRWQREAEAAAVCVEVI